MELLSKDDLILHARQIYKVTVSAVPAAEIFLNDELVGVADKNGLLTIDNLLNRKYVISAKLQNFEFETKEMNLEGSERSLRNITIELSKLMLCGVVHDDAHASVKISSKKRSMTLKTDGGRFCQLLPPGEYEVEPISGLELYPPVIQIALSNVPFLHADFKTRKVSLVVQAKFLEIDMDKLSRE